MDASDVIFVSLTNYDAARSILLTKEVSSHLGGKVLVQMSTGTPAEAREFEHWMRENGGDYIDLIAEAYPEQIGGPDATYLISGSKKIYELVQPYLNLFGGNLIYLGENIGAANALDLGELVYWFGQVIGFVHAARICEAENVPLNQFGERYSEGDVARDFADMVHADNYAVDAIHPGASIATWVGVIQIIQGHSKLSKINSEIPDFIASLFKRALDSGYGEEDAAAIVKMLRQR